MFGRIIENNHLNLLCSILRLSQGNILTLASDNKLIFAAENKLRWLKNKEIM